MTLPPNLTDVHGYIHFHRILIRILAGALIFIAGLLIGHWL